MRAYHRTWTCSILACSVALLLPVAPAQAKAQSAARTCDAMAQLKLPGVEIISAKLVPAAAPGTIAFNAFDPDKIPVAMPQFCRVDGVMNRRKGNGGVEYGIGFALALPANWNGRFMYQGGGGFNGSVREPYGAAATGGNPALARGFAVISSDSGHKGTTFDTTFLRDQQAAADFAFASVPAVTRLGKELTARYFGRAPDRSYADGCSTGGRESMSAAQRYPEMFDGVLVGAPAMRTAHTRVAAWNAVVAFNRIAPKDAAGKPLILQSFTADDQRLLYSALAKACDELDGLKDGMISNMSACRFTPAVLKCAGAKSATCLTADQVGALETAFGGPKDRSGKTVYPGYPYDLGLLGEHVGNPVSVVPYSGFNPYGTPPSPFDLDFTPELDRMAADPIQLLTDTKNWVDLGSLYRRGGKIIFYNGASDPWYSMLDTLDYYQSNRAANPNFDASRFYGIPNMGHCQGGGTDQFDMLTPLVDWVEKGIAPQAVVATGKSLPGASRPLCPWPRYARYNGNGDPKAASSFSCVAPQFEGEITSK